MDGDIKDIYRLLHKYFHFFLAVLTDTTEEMGKTEGGRERGQQERERQTDSGRRGKEERGSHELNRSVNLHNQSQLRDVSTKSVLRKGIAK